MTLLRRLRWIDWPQLLLSLLLAACVGVFVWCVYGTVEAAVEREGSMREGNDVRSK